MSIVAAECVKRVKMWTHIRNLISYGVTQQSKHRAGTAPSFQSYAYSKIQHVSRISRVPFA